MEGGSIVVSWAEGPVRGAERTVSGVTVQGRTPRGWLTGFSRRLTAAEQRVIIRLDGDERQARPYQELKSEIMA